jgi:hypothetical protein
MASFHYPVSAPDATLAGELSDRGLAQVGCGEPGLAPGSLDRLHHLAAAAQVSSDSSQVDSAPGLADGSKAISW